MALVSDQKFSTFHDGGDLAVDDIVVGLRNGINTRFVYTGALPPGVIVPVINGGTGRASALAFALIVGGISATDPFQSVTSGNAGQLLQSNGSSALPTWTTATFPAGSGTQNHLLRSDGTNWVETTATTLTSGDVLSGLSQANISSTSSGATVNLLRLTNPVTSGVNSGVSIEFQPNNSSLRTASIVSKQSTAGNFADLNFYTSGAATPALAMTINTSQQVLIGSATSLGSPQLQIIGVNTVGAATIASFINSASSPPGYRLAKSRSIVPGAFVAVQSGDSLGQFSSFGDDGSTFITSTRIESKVSGTVSAGIVPSLMLFATTTTAGVLTDAMSIDNAQIVSLLKPLPVTSGGSGKASATAYTLLAGGITSTSAFQSLTAGNVGQLLQSNGSSALPTWTTATFPSGSGTLNHLLRSDGTNWVESTSTVLDSSDVLSGLSQMLIGTSTAVGGAQLQVSGLNAIGAGLISSYINTTSGASIRFLKSRSTAIGVQTAVQNADALTLISIFADDGTAFPEAARISANVTGAVSTGIVPSELRFATMTTGGVLTTGMVLSNAQVLSLVNPLALTSGGTNANLTASNGGIVYSTASALAILAGTSTAGQMLQSGASSAPTWTNSTYPATNAVNTLLYASSVNVMSALPTANSSVLVTSAGGVPSLSTALPASLTATNMNLTTPTLGVAAATSINFGGTALSNYTEGTWTPVDSSGAGLTFSSVVARYTRTGRLIIAQATFVFPATGNGAQTVLGGMPFTVANNNGALGGCIGFCSTNFASGLYTQPLVNTSTFRLYNGSTPANNSDMSGATVYVTQIFTV